MRRTLDQYENRYALLLSGKRPREEEDRETTPLVEEVVPAPQSKAPIRWPKRAPCRDPVLAYQTLYHDIYGEAATAETVLAAVAQIRRWQARTLNGKHGVPMLMEATADLLENVHLCKDRCVAGLRFVRFVNAVIDPMQQRLSGPGANMHAIAMTIDMPLAFIDLRHAVAHGAMPHLDVLVQQSAEGLDWLRRFYWTPLIQRATQCGSLAERQAAVNRISGAVWAKFLVNGDVKPLRDLTPNQVWRHLQLAVDSTTLFPLLLRLSIRKR